MLRTQTFDDGSTLTYDDAGNVVAATDNTGGAYYVPGANGSAIVQQFANLFQYGIQGVLNRLGGATSSAAQQAAGAPRTQPAGQAMGGVLVLALAGFLAYQALK